MPNLTYRGLFLHSLGVSLLGILVSARYFQEAFALGAAALIALGLGSSLGAILDRNRREIWDEKIHPFIANRTFAISLTSLFLGTLVVAMGKVSLAGEVEGSAFLSGRYQNGFIDLVQHNAAVLIAGAVFAVLYRVNGLMLVLAYNAVHWGDAFARYCIHLLHQERALDAALLLLALLPHAVAEVLAYIFAGMAGTFISLALSRYEMSSPQFKRVARACGVLVGFSFLALIVAAALEVQVGGPVFHATMSALK